jgi:hypothetical protein
MIRSIIDRKIGFAVVGNNGGVTYLGVAVSEQHQQQGEDVRHCVFPAEKGREEVDFGGEEGAHELRRVCAQPLRSGHHHLEQGALLDEFAHCGQVRGGGSFHLPSTERRINAIRTSVPLKRNEGKWYLSLGVVKQVVEERGQGGLRRLR